MLIIFRARIWIMRSGEFPSKSLLLGTSVSLPCLPRVGSWGEMLHVRSWCCLIVAQFNILPKISISRGWHEGLVTLMQDKSFFIFTFCLLWSHFLRDKRIDHSCYHGINPRVLFSTVWLLLCPSMHAWEMVWPIGLRAGNSQVLESSPFVALTSLLKEPVPEFWLL